VPELVQHLGDDVVGPAKANATTRSIDDARSIIAQITAGLQAERSVIDDPANAAAGVASLEEAKSRIEYLRGPGAKWSVLVGDRITDLSNKVSFHLRGSMREIQRLMDERVEVLSKGDEWDELARYLQTVVADEVTNAFVSLEQGRTAVRGEVIELMRTKISASPIAGRWSTRSRSAICGRARPSTRWWPAGRRRSTWASPPCAGRRAAS
jgi:hypothetical protein